MSSMSSLTQTTIVPMPSESSQRRDEPHHERTRTCSGYGLNKRFLAPSYKGDLEVGVSNPLNVPVKQEDDPDSKGADSSLKDVASKRTMKFINAFNLLIFGKGIYKSIPIFWSILLWLVVIYLHVVYIMASINLPAAHYIYQICFLYFLFAVGATANMHFIWHFIHSRFSIDRTILENCQTFEAQHAARKQLEWVTRVIFLIFALFYIVYCVTPGVFTSLKIQNSDRLALGLQDDTLPYIMFIVTLVIGYVYYNSTFFVCSIWIWKCWLKNNVNASIAEKVTYESILDDSFIKEFESAYALNSYQSEMWRTNHAMRVLTTVPVAYLFMNDGFNTPGFFGNFLVLLGLSFYGLVWFSIAVGGYVNDNGIYMCQRELNRVNYKQDVALTDEQNLYNKRMFKVRVCVCMCGGACGERPVRLWLCVECFCGSICAICTNSPPAFVQFYRMELLLRMESVRTTEGISFAGVLLSVQKAIAVGSLLITVMSLNNAVNLNKA